MEDVERKWSRTSSLKNQLLNKIEVINMENVRIFVCEEGNSRVGLGVELPNGCVAGAMYEPYDDMVLQLAMALQTNNTDKIKDAVEEAPVLDRQQFLEVINRCKSLSDFSMTCDEIPNLPMVIKDTPISYEEMEDLFIELNPEIVALFDQISNGEIEASEPTTIEVDNGDGLVQLIEQQIDEIGSDDDITDNPLIFELIQDNDTYHKKNIGIIPEDQETNLDITEEEHQSLFSRLIDKLTRR